MPSGVPSAILFAILIGVALLALLPALISGSGAESQAHAEQELADSPMRVLGRGKKSPVASGISSSEGSVDSAAETPTAKAVTPRIKITKTDIAQQRRAVEFMDKLARNTPLDAAVQREVVTWLTTQAKRRPVPSDGVTQVLALADKEPYRAGDAWLVRGVTRQRPRLLADPPPLERDAALRSSTPPEQVPRRRAA